MVRENEYAIFHGKRPIEGVSVADIHVHTRRSDGYHSAREVVEEAVTRGLDTVAITDHDTPGGGEEAWEHAQRFDLPIEVIIGQECSTRDGHVGALGITRKIPAGLSAQETIWAIHEQGGAAIAFHPEAPLVPSLAWKTVDVIMRSSREIDIFKGIEVHNSGGRRYAEIGRRWRRLKHFIGEDANDRARVMYNTQTIFHAAGAVGGSDAHLKSQIGTTVTLYPKGIRFLDALRERRIAVMHELRNPIGGTKDLILSIGEGIGSTIFDIVDYIRRSR